MNFARKSVVSLSKYLAEQDSNVDPD